MRTIRGVAAVLLCQFMDASLRQNMMEENVRLGPILAVSMLLAPAPALAQMSAMPQELQDRLAEINPNWGKDIRGNIAITQKLYMPLLKAAPHDGIEVTRDVSYGPHARHKLDVFKPKGAKNMPVLVFLHGGAYVAGDRNVTDEIYANVPLYFARNGMLGVNATYRLAPEAKWPAAAEDVKSIVQWIKANAAQYGGDPGRIYLVGHSAGATHVATYLFHKDIRPQGKPEVAGAVLMSGRYHFDPHPKDPNLANFQAYFGTDRSRYADMSPITHVKDAPAVPLFVVVAEYDNPDLDTQGALLLAEFCKRDRACPKFTRMEHHNHLSMVYQFNTKDELMGREILAFIKRGR
jgi:acetyl esterase